MLDPMKTIQDGPPITTAARVHGVPKTSLHNRKNKGKSHPGVNSGPKQQNYSFYWMSGNNGKRCKR